MKLRKSIFIAAMVLAAPLYALADPAAAMKCRANLSPDAQMIYDRVLPLVTPDTNIRDVIKQQTRSLVFSGKLKRSTARANAEAAGECFRLLRE